MLRPDVENYTDFAIIMSRASGDAFGAVVQIGPKDRYEVGFRLPVSLDDVTRALASAPSVSKMYAQRALSYDSVDPIRKIGGLLFSSLFEGRSRSLYARAKDEADSEGRGLRVQVITNEPDLAAMPWEFLHDGQDFIGLSVGSPVVRGLASGLAVDPTRPPVDQPRILSILANPGKDMPLQPLVDDLAGITKGFPQARLTTMRVTSARQLADAIHDEKCEILYIAGLGIDLPDGDQALALVSDSGEMQPVSSMLLRELLMKKPELRLVYLCAPHTERVARTLAVAAPSVLGIRGTMDQESAAAFSRGLLPSVLDGAPLEGAVTRGRQQVDSENPGSREWGLPVFYGHTPPGTPLVSRMPAAQAMAEPANKPGRAKSPRLSAKEAERRQLDTQLTILTMNLTELEKRKAVWSSGAPPADLDAQIRQVSNKIADVKGKIDETS